MPGHRVEPKKQMRFFRPFSCFCTTFAYKTYRMIPQRIPALTLLTLRLLVPVLLFFSLPVPSRAGTGDRVTDSLLVCIDRAISRSAEYVAQKKTVIADLKSSLARTRDTRSRYDLAYRLYSEYHPFQNDSAIHYLNVCVRLAREMGDESRAGGCTALIALSNSNAGLYVESLQLLKIDTARLRRDDLGLYCYAYAHVLGEIAYYTNDPAMAAHCNARADHYRERMLTVLPPDSKYARQTEEMMAYGRGLYDRSFRMNTQWLHAVRKGSPEYALVSYFRFLEYKALGDSVRAIRSLSESVLADVHNAVMDQGSMWELANQLMVWGDLDRAYSYLCFTSDCANRFGSRQRLSRISPLLSLIAQAYKTKEDLSARRLRLTIVLVSVMALLLLASLYYVYRQRNRLAVVRDSLAQSNVRLQESNTQVQAFNAQLSHLNTQLSEANRVKEEYVGRFMRLCSMYIDKLDELRKKINKKVKAKQYAELYEFTRADFREEEMDELYANFDSAFLHLFPMFVDEFNALLRPDCRVTLTEEGRLPTVLRIFALIRLGVTDSGKIADFLHYSVNTIYNYRAQVKNGALVDRAEFEQRVRQIGRV